MRARSVVRRLLVLCSVLIATGSVVATLEAQEGTSGFSAPTAAVPTPDGAMLVADNGRCVIERIDDAGARTVVAGKVDDCAAGVDGVPATETTIAFPTDAVPVQGGGFLISSDFDCRVRKVGADGIITTIAGTGVCSPTGAGDGGPATEAGLIARTVVPFNPPGQAVELPGEGFLVTGACDVRWVDGDGNIDTVAGNHTCSPVSQRSVDCAGTMCAVGTDLGLVSTTTDANDATWENTGVDTVGLNPIEGISCPTASFCAAIDRDHIHASADPTAQTPSWNSASVPAESIECTSSSLCVAGDAESAGLWRSTNPGAASPAWGNLPPFATNNDDRIVGLSCVQGSNFCAAVTEFGEAATTANVTSDPPGWSTPDNLAGQLRAISCPTQTLCVAAGSDEGLYVSRNASAPDPTWTGQTLPNDIRDVDCPSAGLCVAIDADGNSLTSTNPAADTPTWTEREIHAEHGFLRVADISCPSDDLCVVVEAYEGPPEEAPNGHILTTANPAGDQEWSAELADPPVREGVSATSQRLRNPISAVPTADGGFLVTEVGEFSGPDAGQGSRVRKVSTDGTIRTVAGTGERGYSGDDGPATAAQLYQPTSAVPTPDGGFLVSEVSNCVVRKVGTDGIIRRFAGVAPQNPGSLENCGTQGSGGAATEAQLQRPTSAVTFPGDRGVVIGSLGIANDPDDRTAPLGRVTPSGLLVNALVPGAGAPPPPDQPAPGPGPGPVLPPACTVNPVSARVLGPKKGRKKSKVGVLRVRVTCTQAAAARLSAKLKVTPKRKKGGKKPKAKTVSLKARTGTAVANVPLTLRFKVPKSALRTIKKGGKGSVAFSLAANGAGGSSLATAKISRLRVRR